MDKTFQKILKELEYPPVFLISTDQFEHVEGTSIESAFGISAMKYPVFAIRKGLRGRVKENVVYHEIFHLLFPHRPHWWIECAAERAARGGGRGYFSKKFGKTLDDVPSRERIIFLACRSSRRLKALKQPKHKNGKH